MPNITYGNTEGQYFNERTWERMDDLAKELIQKFGERMEGDVLVDYSQKYDFHNIHFRLDKDNYVVRKYKVFGVTKNPREPEEKYGSSVLGFDSDYDHKTFYVHEYDVVEFFQYGKHRDWKKKT